VSIPSDFRAVLRAGDPQCTGDQNPRMILNYGRHLKGYLECYTVEAAEDIDRRIQRLPRASAARKRLQRDFNGFSKTYIVDDTGRIVLTQKLKEKIGLEGDAYFIAMGDTFQIWDAGAWEASLEAEIKAQEEEEEDEDFDVMSLLPEDDA
jgi:MraZ protein